MVDIAKDLVRFNVTDAAIAELGNKYMKLEITDVNSKDEFEKVHTARMDMVRRRTSVTKVGKELREEALAYQKAVIAEEKRLVALMEPIESHLSTEEQKVIDEKARIKREAEEKEAARIQARVDRIFNYGARFDGQNYIILDKTLPHALLKVCNDEQFEIFCKGIEDAVAAEKAAEEAREAERKAEYARMEQMKAEQEARQKELDAIAKKQAEELAKLEEQRRQIQAELDAIAAKKRAEEEEVIRKEQEAIRAREIEQAKIEAAERAVREAEEKAKRDAEAKAAAEAKAKLAAERKAARAPDKEKLTIFAGTLSEIALPPMKSADGKAVAIEIKRRLDELVSLIRQQIEEM